MKGVKLAQMGLISQQRIGELERKAGNSVDFPLQDAFPWSKCCFGFQITDKTHVRITGGEIQIGDAQPIAAATATLEITVDYSLVGYEYDYSAKTFTVKNFGASITYDSAKYRRWLYEFRLISGAVNLSRINFMAPFLPSNFGDVPA